jgi:hypothetical protein
MTVNNREHDETLPFDAMETVLEPERKIWCAVVSLALIEAARGDARALHWINARGGDFSLICKGYLGLTEDYLCGLLERKKLHRPKLIFGRDI